MIVELLTSSFSIAEILFICKNKTIKQINLIILEHRAPGLHGIVSVSFQSTNNKPNKLQAKMILPLLIIKDCYD